MSGFSTITGRALIKGTGTLPLALVLKHVSDTRSCGEKQF